MAGTHLNFPFDSEIFNYSWKQEPDVILTNMIESGAVVNDSEIARLVSNGSNFFTVPFYDVLTGVEDVYNGVDSFTGASLQGGTYSGCVYGRMAKWSAISFIKDFNSGADPMAQIVRGVAQYWQKQRQARLLGVLSAVFGVVDAPFTTTHITNIATAAATATDVNKVGETTLNDTAVNANGDHAQGYSLAIMHSVVANRLANLQLLNFAKYTDPSGIQRPLPIAFVNGYTVIVNDGVPVADSVSAVGEKEYTTYLLGQGAIRFATAPVDIPSELDRDPDTAGGTDFLYTRIREVMTPYGYSFKGDVATDVGVPDAVLLASASYERKMPVKSIYMAKIVTN